MVAPIAAAAVARGGAAVAPKAAQAAKVPKAKWGPGSRGVNAGRPKAADELARRAQAKNAATTSGPAAAASQATSPAAPAEKPDGGFLAGVREGASQGRSLPPRGGSVVRDGSGIALGFLVWVWVVLPYLNGGRVRVRQVLAAKFLNQGPDGEPLP